ncbi:hypothetical protein ykris0001_46400 [Yersinia kristensenii ATCC 33638]|nr:hypothetical protein ykris0001_46400 [Yersinia kristensenii ATCC 33638]
MIVAIVLGVISQIGFKVYYKEMLNNKSYVVCSGIPGGFYPEWRQNMQNQKVCAI